MNSTIELGAQVLGEAIIARAEILALAEILLSEPQKKEWNELSKEKFKEVAQQSLARIDGSTRELYAKEFGL